MPEITVNLRVVKPWWLPLATKLAVWALGSRAFVLGREISDAEMQPFVEWYGQQLRVVAD